jgi:hypothetical protein
LSFGLSAAWALSVEAKSASARAVRVIVHLLGREEGPEATRVAGATLRSRGFEVP